MDQIYLCDKVHSMGKAPRTWCLSLKTRNKLLHMVCSRITITMVIMWNYNWWLTSIHQIQGCKPWAYLFFKAKTVKTIYSYFCKVLSSVTLCKTVELKCWPPDLATIIPDNDNPKIRVSKQCQPPINDKVNWADMFLPRKSAMRTWQYL